MNDLREWLLDRIDGGEEMRGEDGLVSNFIRQIDAATAELADLKQRLLPQFQGRAQRAEHERDALLEQLIAAPSATGEPVAWLIEYDAAPNIKQMQRIAHMHNAIGDYRQIDSAATAIPLYAGSPPVEEIAIGNARYEYVRTLNPREFAALFDEALHGTADNFDDLVDRRRMKREQSPGGK